MSAQPHPVVVRLRGIDYIQRDYVCHHVAGGEDVFEFAEPVFDETEFWSAIDRDGLGNVPSEPIAALRYMTEACEPHEVFYMQLAKDGSSIRRWSRSPFDGARKCRVEVA